MYLGESPLGFEPGHQDCEGLALDGGMSGGNHTGGISHHSRGICCHWASNDLLVVGFTGGKVRSRKGRSGRTEGLADLSLETTTLGIWPSSRRCKRFH